YQITRLFFVSLRLCLLFLSTVSVMWLCAVLVIRFKKLAGLQICVYVTLVVVVFTAVNSSSSSRQYIEYYYWHLGWDFSTLQTDIQINPTSSLKKYEDGGLEGGDKSSISLMS
ncbi:hypothetical protein ACJX0J_027275, partial [Zea mays]